MALYAKKKEWLETTILLGRVARVKSGIPPATRGHVRRYIRVAQNRVRYLDKDGLYASSKPIIDGLKTVLRRSIRETQGVLQERKSEDIGADGNDSSLEIGSGIVEGKVGGTGGEKKLGRKFESYQGAALIFDDDPAHADWEVTQEKTTGTPQVWIEIQIPEG